MGEKWKIIFIENLMFYVMILSMFFMCYYCVYFIEEEESKYMNIIF